MKKGYLLLVAALALFAITAQAQVSNSHEDHHHEEGHGHEDGHDHGEEGHDHGDEHPGVLIEEMSNMVAAQPGERVLYKFTGLTPRFGLAVQTQLFAEVGVGLDFYQIGYTGASEFVSFGYSNLRPYVSGEIMAGRAGGKLLGGVKVGAEYIRSTPIIGMAFGADASWYTNGSREAVIITPRLMLSLVKVEIYYGYNIFVRNDLRPWIGHHRFGVSMTLNPRFWRRKNKVYEDYYNTYTGE